MKTEEIKNLFAYVLEPKEVAFQYLGYSGLVVRTAQGAIIIDPADKIKGDDLKVIPPGGVNLILFTHDHFDHFNQAAALAIFKATEAPFLAESSVIRRLGQEVPADKLFVAAPEKPFQLGNIKVKVIKGSHVGPIVLFHVTIGEINLFHGADSDYVPLQGVQAELAFLPTGEPSPTASPAAALKMAQDLKPKIIVVIHGSARQHNELEKVVAEKMSGTKVIIPAPYAIRRVKLD